MRTITIDVNGDADVKVDGIPVNTRVASQVAAVLDTADEADDSIRHDTPLEVKIAAACHEANRQYCRMLGDNSQVPWGRAPGWQQASAIDGVRGIVDGRVKTPADSHAQWMAEKLDQGWSYGPQKSEVAKTHPCLVPYAELPADQRKKDLIFFTLATALLSSEA